VNHKARNLDRLVIRAKISEPHIDAVVNCDWRGLRSDDKIGVEFLLADKFLSFRGATVELREIRGQRERAIDEKCRLEVLERPVLQSVGVVRCLFK
jgi:hypothetical protein